MSTSSIILRKTCISNLPVNELKKHGSSYVITISCCDGVLDMFSSNEWEKTIARLYEEAERDVHLSLLIRRMYEFATEYSIDSGSTVYIYEMASILGNNGDKLEIYWDEEFRRFRIVNNKKYKGNVEL